MNHLIGFKVAFLALTAAFNLHSCQFLFKNDGSQPFIIVDTVLKQLFQVAPGQSTMMGDPHAHAHCLVFPLAGNKPLYEFSVIACAKPGSNPSISVSELQSGSVMNIFQVIAQNNRQLAKVVTHCQKCRSQKK